MHSPMLDHGQLGDTCVQARWDNPACVGNPQEMAIEGGCYMKPFGHTDSTIPTIPSNSEECGVGGREPSRRWYKYTCEYASGELRAEDNTEMEMDTNMNMN